MRLSDRLKAVDDKKAPKTAPKAKAVQKEKPKTARPRPQSDGASPWSDAKRKVRELVLGEIGPKLAGPKALKGEHLEKEVKAALDAIVRREDVRISPIERDRFVREVISDTLGYGPLDVPLADPTVTEIMCNSWQEVWLEREGVLEETDLAFVDEAQYRQVIDKIVAGVGRRVDESSPMVDARLPNGSRVNAIVPPLAIKGPVLTIRKFAEDPYTASDLVNMGTFSLEFVHVLEACVRGKLNVLISGGTGTGKTTLLNVLSSFIPTDERIITIEDAAELQLQQPHVVSLESRPANVEGKGAIGIRELVRNSLRMRPDRIVVGEVRGAEALDMLQAMNTGHEGSLTTVHANAARDALSRLETMVLMAGFDLPVRAIREQISAAIHVIIQLERQRDGTRKVVAVEELQGMEGDTILMQPAFRFHSKLHDGKQIGHLEPTGLRPKFLERLSEHGITLPAKVFQPSPAARAERAARTSGGAGRRRR
ncbi:MAG TPA: CpaF family protein [Actinomycetota bacterium]